MWLFEGAINKQITNEHLRYAWYLLFIAAACFSLVIAVFAHFQEPEYFITVYFCVLILYDLIQSLGLHKYSSIWIRIR